MARQNHIFHKIGKGSQAARLADALIERPDSSGSRSIDTVVKLRDSGLKLVVSCTVCEGESDYADDDMVEAFGAGTYLCEVRPDCEHCGSKAVSVMPKPA